MSVLSRTCIWYLVVACSCVTLANQTPGQELETVPVEGQPLAANVERLSEALEYLGAPFDDETQAAINAAILDQDAERLQQLVDPQVLLAVSLNPELRVKADRGPARARLQQGGFTPVIVKVFNDSTVAKQLNISSRQAGAVYSGASLLILERQKQTDLLDDPNEESRSDRFLEIEMFDQRPMTDRLSGLEVEYAVALIYSSESGKREATIEFDIGAGTQDIGFRGEVPVLFEIQPAIPVKLEVFDHDGRPTTGRFTFRDNLGHIYPPQAKRLAPDFFFQPHIYRSHDDVVLLPPGTFDVEFTRGPEYRLLKTQITVSPSEPAKARFPLARWVDPSQFGFYCGDHHIHGAGCSHYENPTQGVSPADMFRQVKGEGLHVGCVLTWGPCFDFQRNYFSPLADTVSEPLTILKYDLEISGFGSAALGHVCLLNLTDQTYPGSEGLSTQGWPTWTVPVMRWAKEQGGFTGYPHSAMYINPTDEGQRLLTNLDANDDQTLSKEEAAAGLLPYAFELVDTDGNGDLSIGELTLSVDRAADEIPNLAIPDMSGAGAMEIFVSAAEGVCDFISAMDTARIQEWNTWYHLMNCGLPIKLSGETDFPCMSSRRVGQGRVYVQLGAIEQIDFTKWCEGLASGRSYVSDGFSHALEFSVAEQTPGTDDVHLAQSATVEVKAKVCFAPEIPYAVAYGNLMPGAGRRMVGDTVNLHAPRNHRMVAGGERRVEIIINGEVVAFKDVPADGEIHDLVFEVPVEKSSWVALRQFPQLHTNPVNVIVDAKPIRASRDSARWCAESVKLLWERRSRFIDETEREAASEAYQRAIELYNRIAEEAR